MSRCEEGKGEKTVLLNVTSVFEYSGKVDIG